MDVLTVLTRFQHFSELITMTQAFNTHIHTYIQLPALTYLPVWRVYTTGECRQNFISVGAGDRRFACFLVLLATYHV